MINVTVTHLIEDTFGERAEALGAPATQMTYARHGVRVSVSTAVLVSTPVIECINVDKTSVNESISASA